MATGLPDLLDTLRLPGLDQAVFADLPVWLWDVDAGRIVFANAAGVSFFGEKRLSALIARRFDMRRPGMVQLERIAATLPEDGTPRLAMLRFFLRLRDIALACSCRLVPRDGGMLVQVAAAAGTPDRRPIETRAALLFGDLDMPVTVERDGEILYRNDPEEPLETGEAVSFEMADERGCLRLAFGSDAAKSAALHEPDPDTQLPREEIAPAAEGEAVSAENDRDREPVEDPAAEVDIAEPVPSAQAHDTAQSGIPKRFSFVLDPDGRFVEIGPALAAVVGTESGGIEGRHWAEIAESLGLDPQGEVAAALVRRDTWSGIELAWPTDEGGTATVRLAAVPRFGNGRVFVGYRGFGDVLGVTCPDMSDGHAEEDEAPVEEPEALDDAASADGPEPRTPTIEPDLPGQKVVRLRPLRTAAPDADDLLNDQERTAFKTIAEALGARMPDDDEALREGAAEAKTEPATGEDEVPAAPERAEDAPQEAPEGTEEFPQPTFERAENGESDLLVEILDRLPLGLAVVRDESILHANRAFLDIFDYSDLDDLEIAGGLGALFEGRGGKDSTAVAGRRRDGTPVAVESRLGRVPWTDGPAMFITAREITEAEHADGGDAGPDQVSELKAILDTASDGVVVLTADGRIEGVNRSAEALFGRDAAEMIGRPFADLVAQDSRTAVRDYLDGLNSGGVMSVLNDGREIVATAAGGGDVPLFLTIGRIGESEPARFCAVMRDLTEWKAAEAELIGARKRAETASAQKSEFLAKMSHEIRTPLNAIIGFAEVILEERFGSFGNERYREYVKDIRESGEHIMSLVNDLLDLSKVEAGKLELNFTGVNLNDIAEQSVAIMQPQANGQRIIIRTSLTGRLPAVVADARSLRQIMLNLLSNGIKFTPPGGQVIVSTVFSDDGEVVLRIRDTGIGMSETDLQAALEPFRQLNVRSGGRQQGTGLGLPLTRALVEANRAAFAIRSQVNEGTLAEVSFPNSRVLAE